MQTNGIVTGKFVMLLGIGCAVILAFANDAKALAIGDRHELGQADPRVRQGQAAITQYVNFMLGLSLGGSDHVSIGHSDILVTRSMNDFGPLPNAAAPTRRGMGTTINLGTQDTYDYLFVQYGGRHGGTAQVWYVGDLTGVISIPSIAFAHRPSGWALFTTPNGVVPDGGTTVMLLGAALGILGVVRRYLLN